MAKRILVKSKNVLFVMNLGDSRIKDKEYTRIAEVDVKKNTFNYQGQNYQVHIDWSVSEIEGK